MSCDTQYVHLAWREQHPELRDLPFPMLADTKRELSTGLGILHAAEGVPLRATYVVDPMGVIRSFSLHDLQVGRSVEEVLRVLAALQTGELTPCGWTPGEATLGAAG
jgi:alkyl hydroperoxide reductase subunit AhpC